MKKKKFKWCIFTVMLALFNFFLVMQAFAEPTIDILIPSAGQSSVIPPGKDFYVLGNLYGLDKQADLSLKVYLTTASGEVVRELEAISFHKPENTYVNYDLLSYYAGSDRSPLANALMPDLVYDNKNINSFADAWEKYCLNEAKVLFTDDKIDQLRKEYICRADSELNICRILLNLDLAKHGSLPTQLQHINSNEREIIKSDLPLLAKLAGFLR